MAMYPGAQLRYGVDLGNPEKTEMGWLTEELEEEYGDGMEVASRLLTRAGISGTRVDCYVNWGSGYLSYFLETTSTDFYAYTPAKLSAADLEVPDDGAHDRLRAAWTVLYPGVQMPRPGWVLTLSYR